MKVSTPLRKLFFTSVDLEGGPNFVLPCGHSFKPKTEMQQLKDAMKAAKDLNNLVSFTCPVCGAKIELHVALHKNPEESLTLCIQRSDMEGTEGIAADWWKRELT